MSERKRKLESAPKNNSTPNNNSAVYDEEEEVLFSDEEGGIRFEDIYIPPPSIPACAVDASAPRLIITKFVNENFKSYANEVIVGPFHKCFNAIVGPNGSGKSNVIDSMLFVFGYRASKIRSKKLSVLLHNSESYTNIQSCTVAVHFQLIIDKEGDDFEVVPNSEFVVSRTAHKDNSSYYQLNGKRVQFKEVALLLRKYHIDLDHNRFLILQGEVEQIAMMKPKGANENESGMLEYLEDIIGTSRFKVPLEKLYERIEILNEQRLEKLNRVKLVDKEKSELEGPMKEAVGFLKLENEVAYKKNILMQKQMKDTTKNNMKLEEDKLEIQTKLKESEETLAQLNEEKAAKESVISEAAKKYNDLEKRRDELKAAFDKANNRDISLAEEMQQKNKRRKKTIELLKEERLNLEKLQAIPEKNEGLIEELTKREGDLATEKVTLGEEKTKALSTLQADTKELRASKEVLQTRMIDLKKVVHETKSEYSLAERELKICQSNEESERTKLENLREQFVTNEATVTTHREAIKELKPKIPLTEQSLATAQKQLQKVKQQEATAIQEVRRQRINIEETRSSMQATKSKNRVLDTLMREKHQGNCPGFFGRLGDLGAIEQKYDVAVSTACGPLDNIVVDTVTTAQWCIEFLKHNDIGRGTFIALEKQEHLREIAEQPLRTPENVPRLYDLIRVEDERIAPAFYYALRDTLVAKDLDQASRIAYGKQRFRVVTVGGDLIETAGTMSGGGKAVMRGRMGQQVAVKSNVASPEEVARMENDLREVEAQVTELRKKQMSLENQISALQPELQKMKIDLEKFTREVQTLAELKPKIERQIKEQELKSKSTKADAAQVEKLTKLVNTKKAAYDEASERAKEVQTQVDEITKEIDGKTKGKMKLIEQRIKQNTEMLNKCKAEVTKLKVAINTSDRNCKKSAEKISTMEQDIKEMEDSMRAMKKEREEIESDASDLLKFLENITKQLNEEENDYADEKKAIDVIAKSINGLKSERIEIEQKLKGLNKTISEQKAQISQWKAQLSRLTMQEIPDETVEPLREMTDEELDCIETRRLEREIGAHTEIIKTSKPNLNAIKNYLHKKEQYMARLKELEDLTEKRQMVRNKHDEWRKTRLDEFLQGFRIITMKLKEMYQMITMGGDADLELVDTFDPFNEGVVFNVRPPKKTWKNISNLSGGEKTLSSLALVFALHYYKPSPLYVMDEIDAALDFKNVSIVGNYIKERTKNAQFIIISLRSNMFELCDYLVGIYKTYNCTHSLTIDPRAYDKNRNETDVEEEVMEQETIQTAATISSVIEQERPLENEDETDR